MFVWANTLIDQVPRAREWLRRRFPVLFLDEVQDNSEIQSRVLKRIFMEGADAVIRQRFGDSNQAIYQDIGGTRAQTDEFPDTAVRISLENSYRFDQSIAELVDPLGVVPAGLRGLRPTATDSLTNGRGRHTVFLFEPEDVTCVLERYAEYLVESFSEEELRSGLFTAVGAVHRSTQDDKVPRSVRHYWGEYDAGLGQLGRQPKTFLEHVARGEQNANRTGRVGPFVEAVAEGVLRTVRRLDAAGKMPPIRRPHAYVMERLAQNNEMRSWYEKLVMGLCVERIRLTRQMWEQKWQRVTLAIARAVARTENVASIETDFLVWNGTGETGAGGDAYKRGGTNIYQYPAGEPVVKIQVGSIHSVKGETHTATLVLETFYRAHHLRKLKDWLVGAKSGGEGEDDATRARLRQHYVAMSRPTHLLCLAMRDDALDDSEIDGLRRRGWRVGRAGPAKTDWIRG